MASFSAGRRGLSVWSGGPTEDFVYPKDKHGERYGFGWALLNTPENTVGRPACHCERTPEESFQRMLQHLHQQLPQAYEKTLRKLIE